MIFDYKRAFEYLSEFKQEHLLKFYEGLNPHEKEMLLKQIAKIDLKTFHEQQKLIKDQPKPLQNLTPLESVISYQDLKLCNTKKKLLSEGLFGCLLVAGGQGSRLNFKDPKGLFQVSIIKKKSLFQIFSEKALAASKLLNSALPIAIMTSDENDLETKNHFKNNHFFGLDKNQISFFTQKNLPLLDLNGDLFLENPYTIAKAPDGNGDALKHFFDSGIFKKWKKLGVCYVNYLPVDNPLADPFDFNLFEYHHKEKADVIIKCILREDADEKVGVLVKNEKQVQVIEYTEIDEKERLEKTKDGELKFKYANISLFSFSMDFIQKIALMKSLLPLHKVLKRATYLTKKGHSIKSENPDKWKFEKFIFDLLTLTHDVKTVCYPRKNCFSPLKNLNGKESVNQVQEDMQEQDLETLKKITGKNISVLNPLEIAQDFYYPSDALLLKWKGKESVNEHYIEP